MLSREIERSRILTQSILKDEGKYYFLLMYQARLSVNLPDRVKELFSKYSMKAYVDLMMPIFEDGQRAGDIVAIKP